MNDHPPYYDEQWDDLPLPDGDLAWEKMEHLLEKKKRRRVLPFWFWRYAALSLSIGAILLGGWLFLHGSDDSLAMAGRQQEMHSPYNKTKEPHTEAPARKEPSPDKKMHTKKEADDLAEKLLAGRLKQQKDVTQKVAIAQNSVHKPLPSTGRKLQTTSRKKASSSTKKTVAISSEDELPNPTSTTQQTPTVATATVDTVRTLSYSQSASPVVNQADTLVKKDSTALLKQGVDTLSAEKQKAKKTPAFMVSAGVGLQQAVGFGSRRDSAGNTAGSRAALSDYLPSVYLRLQRGKWYLQTEFSYYTPQPVQPFSFSQTTRYEAAANTLSTERFSIQKLYYHQVHLTLNYFIAPRFSVGVGGVFNRLAGAVTEREVGHINLTSGVKTTLKSSAPVKGYKDSFLYKTTAGILLQTDYHRNRFSFGIRYLQNLQPFIKYTKPNGQVLDEKNKVLQLLLRFRLL